MTRFWVRLAALAVLSAGPAIPSVFALSTNTSAAFLSVSAGSRPAALAGAYSAVADDVFALQYNPAGLHALTAPAVAFQHNEWGLDMRQEFICAAIPLSQGVLGLGVTYMNYGTVERRDDLGNPTGNDMSPSDFALSGGYSLAGLGPDVYAGAALNIFNESLADTSAFGLALTVGGQYLWRPTGLKIGAVLRNVGTPLSGYSLPSLFSAGAAYALWQNTILVSLDGEVPLASGVFQLAMGAEVKLAKILAIRAGYRAAPAEGADGLQGFSAGLGLAFAHWGIDYAYQPLGSMAEAHRITLQYLFGPESPRAGPAPGSGKAAKPAGQSAKAILLPTPTPETGLRPEKEQLLQPSQPTLSTRQIQVSPEDRKRAIRYFLRGRDLHQEHKYDLAIDQYKKALEIYPAFKRARRALAWAKRDRARRQLSGGPQPRSPRDAVAEARTYYTQGQELERQNKLLDAALAYKTALELMPGYAEARKALQRVQTQARENRKKVITRPSAEPMTPPAPRTAAKEEVLSSLQVKRPKKAAAPEAEDSMDRAIQKHLINGTQAYEQGDYAEAIREFELILEFDPEHRQAKFKAEQARKKMAEEVHAAKKRAEEAKAQGDNLREVDALREAIMLNPKDEEARKAYQAAKVKSADDIEEIYKNGVSAYAQGRYRDAIRMWNQVLDLDPDHKKARESIEQATKKQNVINE